MSVRVTMRDVAREAGVSPMTVSRALKVDGAVNARTREIVQEAAERLGYVYDSTAQAFRSQRSGFVAFTLPSVNNANFATTHRALTAALSDTDLQLLLGITNYDVDQEERMILQLLARRPDAVILTGGTHTEETRRILKTVSLPIFEVWDIPQNPLGHVIGFSNFDAMALVVSHLAEQGRRRLGFVGAQAMTDNRGNERRNGVVEAARNLGLPPVVDIDTGPAPATMSNGAAAIMAGREIVKNLDALICVSDPVAYGAIMALQKIGLRVPDDLAVTGFGNFEISQVSQPSITTLDVGADQIGTLIGRAATRILFPEESDYPTGERIVERVTPTLQIRQSSAMA